MRNYATQMDAAKRGIVTPEIETVAKKENRPVEFIMERVAKGTIAIPANINHKSLSAEAVGDGTRVKINVNLGISGDCKDYEMELRKVRMAVDMGAESIMDLSNYGKTNTFRKQLIDMSPAMIGTVPMYDAIGYLEKDLLEITAQDFLKVVEAHAREGVDFMTIHAGINRRAVEAFMREGRRMNIVSRGGSLLFAWMKMTGNENPFFEYYDEVLDILRRYDVTISLGDALHPGCIDDASDAGQISELIELGNLARYDRRPRPYGDERDCAQYADGKVTLPWSAFLCPRPARYRHCTGLRPYHLGHRRRHRRTGGRELPVLRYTGGAPASAG